MQPALPPQALQVADAVTVRGLRGAPLQAFTTVSGGSGLSGSGPGTVSPSPSPQPPESHTPTQDETPIICRLAERVRLKRVSEHLDTVVLIDCFSTCPTFCFTGTKDSLLSF